MRTDWKLRAGASFLSATDTPGGPEPQIKKPQGGPGERTVEVF
jgi:hypothetical protein